MTGPGKSVSRQPAHGSSRRRLEIAVLLVLIPLAIYFWAAPILADHALAKASLEELVADSQHDPNNPRVFHYLGLRYQATGDTGQALEAFSKAAQMSASDETSWLGWAAASEALGKEDDAYRTLTAYLKLHTESAPAHYALAQIYARRRVHKAAWEEAHTALKYDPQNADIWRLSGEEALQWGNPKEAIAGMQQAVRLKPQDWRNQMGLGNVLMAQDQSGAAIPCFQEAVRLAPNQPTAQLCLGRALLKQAHAPEEITAAQKSLHQALALQPDLAPAYPLLANSYITQGRWKEAQDLLSRGEQVAPRNIDIVFALQKVYQHSGNRALADQYMRRHQTLSDADIKKRNLISRIAKSPNDIAARLEVARLCAANGDDTEAQIYYRSAIARSSDPEPIRRELAAFEESAAHTSGPATPNTP